MAEIQGINVDELTMEMPFEYPPMVKGRTLHLDGDMLAYECACHDDEPFARMKQAFAGALEMRMAVSGSEFIHVHFTGGDKGGRHTIARVKEYQGNRKGKVKPKQLDALKYFFAEKPNATMHEDQEADDGMAQANYAANKASTPELSVIMSGDKDLTMCSGWHCNWKEFDMVYVDGFGYTELVEIGKAKTKKVKGYGTKFFWTQLLMGDTADNIPGLPKILKANGKLGPCGAVAAFKLLEDAHTDLDCLTIVLTEYRKGWYGQYDLPPESKDKFEYEDWRGVVHKLNPSMLMYEQALLLWMRRTVNEDVAGFFMDVQQGRSWYEG